MGVLGLWDALKPAGRVVDIRTLSGKWLAVDASIWIMQIVKAVRDKDGVMVKNAHLEYTLRRICKVRAGGGSGRVACFRAPLPHALTPPSHPPASCSSTASSPSLSLTAGRRT